MTKIKVADVLHRLQDNIHLIALDKEKLFDSSNSIDVILKYVDVDPEFYVDEVETINSLLDNNF